MQLRRDQPSSDQCLRFGRKGDAIGGLGEVKRLDAERVARQQHLPRGAVMNRNGIHAAQKLSEACAIAAIQMQGRFAIRSGGGGQRMIRAQFAVIIDLAIRDQGGSAGEERLIACRKINDCKAGLGESDIARKMMPRAIRPAMRQRARQRFQHRGRR